jgi:hypothetical protein
VRWLAVIFAGLMVVSPAAAVTVDERLTAIVGAEVRVYPAGEWERRLAEFGFPEQGLAFYEPLGPTVNLNELVGQAAGVVRRGFYRRHPGLRKAGAFVIYLLARERAHVQMLDPMHGQPGHRDDLADQKAWRQYIQVALALGIASRGNAVALKRLARTLI